MIPDSEKMKAYFLAHPEKFHKANETELDVFVIPRLKPFKTITEAELDEAFWKVWDPRYRCNEIARKLKMKWGGPVIITKADRFAAGFLCFSERFQGGFEDEGILSVPERRWGDENYGIGERGGCT